MVKSVWSPYDFNWELNHHIALEDNLKNTKFSLMITIHKFYGWTYYKLHYWWNSIESFYCTWVIVFKFLYVIFFAFKQVMCTFLFIQKY